jgi:hypothetical protein
MFDGVFAMTADHLEGLASARFEPYRALLAVSEAIASHRDLPALFHELAGRLHHVVRFDYLALVLHEAATSTMRLHVLGASAHRIAWARRSRAATSCHSAWHSCRSAGGSLSRASASRSPARSGSSRQGANVF